MADWEDPRGNLEKFERLYAAGEMSYNEMVDKQSAEIDWIMAHCRHKNREPDTATVWCGDCGKNLGPSASTSGSGGNGGVVKVGGGGCVVAAVALVSATAWGLMEAARAIL